MARRGLNQAHTVMELARDQGPVEVPAGVTFTADEAQLWPVFTSARVPEDWRAVDLILLAQGVKLEAMIRREQAVLDQEGPLITTPRGTLKAHPLFKIIDTLNRQLMAIVRTLGLHTQGDSRTLAARAAKARTYAQASGRLDDSGLVAHPAWAKKKPPRDW